MVSFDDETRDIRAHTNALLRRVHEPLPPRCSKPLLSYTPSYDVDPPMRITSDAYIQRMLGPLRSVHNDVETMSYYPEPGRQFIGKGHLACMSFAGGRAFSKRRNLAWRRDDDYRVKNDVTFLSHYDKMRSAAAGLDVPNGYQAEGPGRYYFSHSLNRYSSRNSGSNLNPDYVPAKSVVDERSFNSKVAREEIKLERAKARETTTASSTAAASDAAREERLKKKKLRDEEKRKEEEEAESKRMAAEEERAREMEERRREAEKKERERQAEIERQAELERLEKERQAELEQQAELERQAEAERQAELERQAEAERQAELERQAEAERKAELERQAEAERQAELERQEQERQAEIERQEQERQAELERQAKEEADAAAAAEEEAAAPPEEEAVSEAKEEAEAETGEVASEEETATTQEEPEATPEEPAAPEVETEKNEEAVDPVVEEPLSPEAPCTNGFHDGTNGVDNDGPTIEEVESPAVEDEDAVALKSKLRQDAAPAEEGGEEENE